MGKHYLRNVKKIFFIKSSLQNPEPYTLRTINQNILALTNTGFLFATYLKNMIILIRP